MIKKKIILHMFFIIVFIIFIILIYLYNEGYFQFGEPPFLKASTLPVKIRPDNIEKNSTNYNPIYDQIKTQNMNNQPIFLMPEPESPLPLSLNKEIDDNDVISDVISSVIDSEQEIKDNKTSSKLKVIKVEDDKVKDHHVKKVTSSYFIQLESVKSKTEAVKKWEIIKKSNGSLLKNLNYKIQKYKINGKTYYRLLGGPLNNFSKAKQICKKLIIKDQYCIVKKI